MLRYVTSRSSVLSTPLRNGTFSSFKYDKLLSVRGMLVISICLMSLPLSKTAVLVAAVVEFAVSKWSTITVSMI